LKKKKIDKASISHDGTLTIKLPEGFELPEGIEKLSQTSESNVRKLALAPVTIKLLIDARTLED